MRLSLQNYCPEWVICAEQMEDIKLQKPQLNYVPSAYTCAQFVLVQYIVYAYLRRLGYRNETHLAAIASKATSLPQDPSIKPILTAIEAMHNYCKCDDIWAVPFNKASMIRIIYEFLNQPSDVADEHGYIPYINAPLLMMALDASGESIKEIYGTTTISTGNAFSYKHLFLHGEHVVNDPVSGILRADPYPIAAGLLSSFSAPVPYAPNEAIKPTTKFELLERYDWKDAKMPVTDFIAFVSNFALPDPIDYYHMSNFKPTDSEVFGVFARICRNVVSGDDYLNQQIPKDICKLALDAWIEFSNYLASINGLVTDDKDNELLVKIISLVDSDPKLMNYCTKPIVSILASEALAYSSSAYTNILSDRFAPGMEAENEEDAKDDEALSSGGNNESDTSDAGDENTDDFGGDDDFGDDSMDENDDADDGTDDEDGADTGDDEEDSNPRPAIDPNMTLFELSKPDSSMRDWTYRSIVARRITSVIKNPPENAKPADLILLKRWRSRWLYLVSIPCLRDVLTRISLRLS